MNWPDFFVTFTCNEDWEEIKQELFTGQRSFDRHDIIVRVFHLKMKKMIKILTKDAIFGSVKCDMLTVELQKRRVAALSYAILARLENTAR